MRVIIDISKHYDLNRNGNDVREPWPEPLMNEEEALGGRCWVYAKSHLTLYDPMGHGPPGSSIRGIIQARILE